MHARREVGAELLANPEIDRVTYLHLEFVGPGKILVVAAVDLVGDRPEQNVAERLRALSDTIAENEVVEVAVLTLSVADEPSLTF